MRGDTRVHVLVAGLLRRVSSGVRRLELDVRRHHVGLEMLYARGESKPDAGKKMIRSVVFVETSVRCWVEAGPAEQERLLGRIDCSIIALPRLDGGVKGRLVLARVGNSQVRNRVGFDIGLQLEEAGHDGRLGDLVIGQLRLGEINLEAQGVASVNGNPGLSEPGGRVDRILRLSVQIS